MRAYLAAFLAILLLSVAAVHPKARYDPNDSLSFRQRAWGATGALMRHPVPERKVANPRWHFICSGVAIGRRPQGVLFVSASHCVEEGNFFKVTFAPDESGGYPATLLGESDIEDISLWLVAAPASTPTVPLGSEYDLQNGDALLSISYPADIGKMIRTGRFIAPTLLHLDAGFLDTVLEWAHAMPIELPLIKGMSGGPLFDEEHSTLVGIVVGKWADVQLAIPASRIRTLVNKYEK